MRHRSRLPRGDLRRLGACVSEKVSFRVLEMEGRTNSPDRSAMTSGDKCPAEDIIEVEGRLRPSQRADPPPKVVEAGHAEVVEGPAKVDAGSVQVDSGRRAVDVAPRAVDAGHEPVDAGHEPVDPGH